MNASKNLVHYIVTIFCIIGISALSLSFASTGQTITEGDKALLKERIEFKVSWSFIPLIHTFMELYGDSSEKLSQPTYRLAHQASMNSFWNDRMESVIDSRSLLPYMMETIIKDGEKMWKEKVVFDRQSQKATFIHQNRKTGEKIVDEFFISPLSMDPLSAFYNLRHRISPAHPYAAFEGLTGSKRFKIEARFVGQESVDVPAGSFGTFRIKCTLSYWPCKGTEKQLKKENKDEIKSFTLWVTKDANRFPVQIRYRLSVGSLWVRAVSILDHGIFS